MRRARILTPPTPSPAGRRSPTPYSALRQRRKKRRAPYRRSFFLGFSLRRLRGISLCGETLENMGFERFLERLQLDLLEDVGRKRISEQPPCVSRPDSTAQHVEKSSLIEPSDCRAVRALHVVREDLQLRLRVHSGFVGEQEIVVALLPVGFLCLGVNVDLSVEHPVRAPVEYALVQLVTRAVRRDVLDA